MQCVFPTLLAGTPGQAFWEHFVAGEFGTFVAAEGNVDLAA